MAPSYSLLIPDVARALRDRLPMKDGRLPDRKKKTDSGPLDSKLRPEDGGNRAARRYPNPSAAQDLDKKTDSEQPRGAGGT